MALKLDYVIRETSTNMRRNVTLTLAAVVTIGVSLSLFGSALLVRFGVDNLTARWDKGIEVVVFLKRDITDEQKTALQQKFKDDSRIASLDYMDDEASQAEFRRLFRRNGAMLERMEADPHLVPTSYRLSPQSHDRGAIEALAASYASSAGVLRSESATEAIRTIERMSSVAQGAIITVSIGLLVAALLLILNAIRTAMFARRREIEVMKLVGATNWFIRIPFMVEGVVEGMLGAACALISVFFLDRYMTQTGSDAASPTLFSGMVASGSEVILVMTIVVVLGVVIGAAGSGWAISRFLRV